MKSPLIRAATTALALTLSMITSQAFANPVTYWLSGSFISQLNISSEDLVSDNTSYSGSINFDDSFNLTTWSFSTQKSGAFDGYNFQSLSGGSTGLGPYLAFCSGPCDGTGDPALALLLIPSSIIKFPGISTSLTLVELMGVSDTDGAPFCGISSSGCGSTVVPTTYIQAVRFGDVNFSEVAPVPEPETYALMLAGLGLVGVMARRRKAT
jgi:hypothetical protein